MLVMDIACSVREAVAGVMSGGHWQHYEGPYTNQLELRLAGRINHSHVQLTSSGTAALEVVLRAANIGVGDEVLLSGYDYPGNFWAIERVGARAALVDTLADSWRIDLASLERTVQPTCKALIASHLHGELQKVDELRAWCDQRSILLIEDVCQSIGANWNGLPAGNYGHAAILSFGGGKLLSCGRGGAWATSDETLAIRARVASGAGSGPYALSQLQAAIVLAQLPWLDEINLCCRAFFKSLDDHLKAAKCDWAFVPSSSLDSTAFYQCGWRVKEKRIGEDRQKLLEALYSRQPANGDTDLELPMGVGFPGFHRRSPRRCRISRPLIHATAAANTTLVLHHRTALQQQWTSERLAQWIASCIDKVRKI